MRIIILSTIIHLKKQRIKESNNCKLRSHHRYILSTTALFQIPCPSHIACAIPCTRRPVAPITPDTHHMLQRGGIPVHCFGTMARGLKDATAVESDSHKTRTMCIRSLELPWKSGRCDTDVFSREEKMRAVTSKGELLPQKQCERRETTPERLSSDFHMQILVHN